MNLDTKLTLLGTLAFAIRLAFCFSKLLEPLYGSSIPMKIPITDWNTMFPCSITKDIRMENTLRRMTLKLENWELVCPVLRRRDIWVSISRLHQICPLWMVLRQYEVPSVRYTLTMTLPRI